MGGGSLEVAEALDDHGGDRWVSLPLGALKRQIIAESFEPGASVADVERRNGVNANLLFTRRRQQGAAKMADNRQVAEPDRFQRPSRIPRRAKPLGTSPAEP
jgi:Transposase